MATLGKAEAGIRYGVQCAKCLFVEVGLASVPLGEALRHSSWLTNWRARICKP